MRRSASRWWFVLLPSLMLGTMGCGGLGWSTWLDPQTWLLRWQDDPAKLARFGAAWAAWEGGEVGAAEREFLRLALAMPELADHALYLAAEAAARSGRAHRQRARLAALARRFPQSVWFPRAALGLARAALEARRPEEARHWTLRALSAPNASEVEREARLILARVDEQQGRRSEAAASYRELWRTARGSGVGREAKQGLLALRASDPALRPSAAMLVEEARWALEERDLELAERSAEEALRSGSPDDAAAAATVLGEVAYRAGRREQAWRTFWGVAQRSPQSPWAPRALFRLASLLWNADRDTAAERVFAELAKRYPGSDEAAKGFLARARMALQRGDAEQALALLARMDAFVVPADLNREVAWWKAWAHWLRADCQAAARAFAAFGDNDAAGSYWRARAEEACGNERRAQELYARVEESDPGYYGLLAARRRRGLGSLPLRAATDFLAAPMSPPLPALEGGDLFHQRRWQLLLAAGVHELAKRELAAFLPSVPVQTTAQRIAVLEALQATAAYREAVAQARSWVDLEEGVRGRALYPLAYWDAVSAAAREFDLDPLLLLAVMRQESLFEPKAESAAGARGLMQVMPATAQQAAAALGIGLTSEQLSDPTVNVRLGARHLRQLLDRYQNDLVRALAAYNGGERAADRWSAQAAGRDPDEFVERITYRETREYVKRVLAHYRNYVRLYSSSSSIVASCSSSPAPRVRTSGSSDTYARMNCSSLRC